jgi:homoserine trans-succinylase
MEHVTELWSWIKELHRILKFDGDICIIAPSTGKEHTEYDYWRIMPKGMKFILEWGGFKKVEVNINSGKWNDVIGTGKKSR